MTESAYAIGEQGAHTALRAEDPHVLLAQASVVDCEIIPWSSNYTFAARMALDGYPDFLAIYKPRRGEVPLYDFPDGTLYRRERAAYVAAKALGWEFVPPTIIRHGPHGIGSVQLYIDPQPRADFFAFRDEHRVELQRIALFDVIANNADRKAGHCLKGRDGRIWGIDHGLTFNAMPKLRTVIWDYAGEPVPGFLLEDLRRFREQINRVDELQSQLAELLSKSEVASFFGRIDAVLQRRSYPLMSSRRSVPWPWF